jgi:hypothetical protein
LYFTIFINNLLTPEILGSTLGVFCERDSSGTTRNRVKRGAGDGADSPTRAGLAPRSGSPNGILLRKIQLKIKN